jgi:hypothetical protein
VFVEDRTSAESFVESARGDAVRSTGARRRPSLLLALAALACGAPTEGTLDDAGPRADRPRPSEASRWSVETIDEGDDVGLWVRHAIDADDVSHVAYFATEGEVIGPCDLGVTDDVPDEVRWTLRHASGGASFVIEEVTRVLSPTDPPGLDLAIGPRGPAIAALTGGPVTGRLCQAHDLGIYERSGATWEVEVAAAESGQASTGMAASDFGTVVGHWPALAFGAEGARAVAYKDVHNGSIQTDDLFRADLELAFGDGAWSHVAVDAGRGAGSFTRAAFDVRGRLVLAFVNPVEEADRVQQGLWVARTREPLGTSAPSFEAALLEAGPIRGAPALAVRGSLVHVLVYDASRGIPRLHRLVDDAAFESLDGGWSREAIGDARYDEGLDPSLAFDADGRLGAAWFRCARTSGGRGSCDESAGLVFAWTDDPASAFEREVVTEGREECGRTPALAFARDGEARIAFHCQSDGVEQVRLARRDPL